MVKVPATIADFSEEDYQVFVDALQERASKQHTAPDTKILAIQDSEHRQTIFNCLANNWSASRVHAYLIQTAQVDVPTSAIEEYRASIDKDAFLPVTYLQSKFKELDIEIDAIGELARLLKLSQERLDMALFLESISHPLYIIVDQQKREYWNLLREYLAIQKGLGFFTKDTVGAAGQQDMLPASILPRDIPTIRHLLELRITTERSQSSEPIDVTPRVLTQRRE